MKKLKNYIKNYINESYLNESAWDIEDNIEDDNKELVLNEVKKFIEDNYDIVDINSCEFVFDEKKGKYIVNLNGKLGVILKNKKAKQLTNELFEWGVIGGDFSCAYCPELESLKGAPEKVGGAFSCGYCSKLTSLQGAPKEVGNQFNCSKCPITSLQGAPKKVGGGFNCVGCNKLSSLKGAPKEVGRNFNCVGCSSLHSLDGIGKVKGRICSDIR